MFTLLKIPTPYGFNLLDAYNLHFNKLSFYIPYLLVKRKEQHKITSWSNWLYRQTKWYKWLCLEIKQLLYSLLGSISASIKCLKQKIDLSLYLHFYSKSATAIRFLHTFWHIAIYCRQQRKVVGVTSKPNCQLTGGSIQFRMVVTV